MDRTAVEIETNPLTEISLTVSFSCNEKQPDQKSKRTNCVQINTMSQEEHMVF